METLLAELTARPRRAAPLAALQARLATLAGLETRELYRFLVAIAEHETRGYRWHHWELFDPPRLTARAITTGMFADGATIAHSLQRSSFGTTTLSSYGETTTLGPFAVFVTDGSRGR